MDLWRGKMTVGVSATLIVRDEEDGIARAIGSLERLGAIDEIVVLDTGSTDRTAEIAADLGARVLTESWTGDFAHHRNHCLERCRHDWVFALDGDEELVDPGNLVDFFAEPRDAALAVHIDSVGLDGSRESGMAVRAFDRTRGRWKYPIHEQVVGPEHLLLTSARIVTGYDETLEATTRQRLEVLLEFAQAEPEEPHYGYHVAKLYRVLGDLESARHWALRYIGLNTGESREAELWVFLVEAALARKNRERGHELLQEALARHPGYPDLHHQRMSLVALDWYESVTRPAPRYMPVPGRSRGHARKLPEAADRLGMPLRFSR